VAESVAILKADHAVLQERIGTIQRQIEVQDYVAVVQRLSVLEAHLADLKRAKDESDKRQWQFVYIFAGAMASLLVTVVVQLVLAMVKK
jgi:hypothetical protein